MSQDAEQCLEAGMNEHVSKPIEPDAFLRTVKRYVPGVEEAGSVTEVAGDTASPDVDEAHLDGLAKMLPAARFAHMLGVYLEGASQRLDRIGLLAGGRDLSGIAGEAHDLKSTSGNFGARRLQHLAEELETVAKAGDAAAVARLLPAIQVANKVASEIISRRMSDAADAGQRRAS
jgi:HPt (histidine-containing phosphotransfer) domain-containing protein